MLRAPRQGREHNARGESTAVGGDKNGAEHAKAAERSKVCKPSTIEKRRFTARRAHHGYPQHVPVEKMCHAQRDERGPDDVRREMAAGRHSPYAKRAAEDKPRT